MAIDPYGLMSDLSDELGEDIYALSESDDVRHALLESVVAAVLGGLLVLFLEGVVDPRQAGAVLRSKVKTLIASARRNENPVDRDSIKEQLVQQLDKAMELHSDGKIDDVQLELETALVEEGINSEAAQRISKAVARVCRSTLKPQ